MILTGTLFPSKWITLVSESVTGDVMAEVWILVEKSPEIHDMVEIIFLKLVGHCFDSIHKGIHDSFCYFCDILAVLIFFL